MRKFAIVIERKTMEVWECEARTSHEAVMQVAEMQAAGEKPTRIKEVGRKVLPVKPILEDDDPKLPGT